MTPSLEIGNGNWAVQSDSLLGYKTINGKYYPREMSVTRATTATRVNAAGLVELVPYNFLFNSENFSTWNLEGGTLTSGQLDPLGGNTAYKYDPASGGLYSTSVLNENQTQVTYSFWAKSVYGGNLNMILADGGGYNSYGTISIDGTWKYYTFTLNRTTPSVGGMYLYNISNSQGFYIWHPQINIGSTAKDYLPTTTRLNIARIDYSTGSPALLVEPQRTNLLDWSEDFTNVVWTKNTGVSVISDSSISPSGVQNADTIVGATGPFVWGGAGTFVRGVGSLSSSTPYTFSVYLKGSGSVTITCRDGGTGFTNNVVCALTSSWQRFEISRTTAAASTQLAYIFSDASGNFDIWGAQLEAGNYSTSYIPTASASVTRNADVISKTGISSLIGQTEGTIFMDFTLLPNNSNNSYLFSISDGSTNNIIRSEIYVDSPSIYQFRTGIATLGVSQGDAFTNITQPNNKMAISYKLNEVKIFLNGVLVATDTSVTIPATSQVHIGNRNNTDLFIGSYYKSFVLFPTALTNAQLAQLTTL
jgi:hypothetical protein